MMKVKKLRRKVAKAIKGALFSVYLLLCDVAMASGGLSKVTSSMEKVKGALLEIIPIVAAVALMIMGFAYSKGFIQKKTFADWAIGLIIAGSAVEITAWFIGK